MTGFEIGLLSLGGANLAGSLFGQKNAAEASQEQIDYMKWAQQNSWMREDNAVQRRVADLRAAGLSPTLAAGSAAQSSAPITVGQRQTIDPGAAVAAAIQPVIAASQLRSTDADIALKRAQEQATLYDTASKNWKDQITALFFPQEYAQKVENINKTIADTGVASAEAGLRYRDLMRDRKSGAPKGSKQQEIFNLIEAADPLRRDGMLDSMGEIGVPGWRARKDWERKEGK